MHVDKFSCDTWCDFWAYFPGSGCVPCYKQEEKWEKRVKNAKKRIITLDREIRDLEGGIKTMITVSENPNPGRIFKIGGGNKYTALRIAPSSITSGHAAVYLGLDYIEVYESLK